MGISESFKFTVDSQADIKAIRCVKSKCIRTSKIAAYSWFPGYTDVVGNEKANLLSHAGAATASDPSAPLNVASKQWITEGYLWS